MAGHCFSAIASNCYSATVETIAIANSKGGTAKTTTAVSLAGVWSQAGLRVRLIDLDPEAWLSKWIAGDGADDGKGLAEALMEAAEGREVTADLAASLVRPSVVPNVEIIAAGRWLGRAERTITTEAWAQQALARVLTQLPVDGVDLTMVDCPRAAGLLTVLALVAAGWFLVPVEAQAMALGGVKSLMELVGQVRDNLNPKLRELSVVPCRAERTVLARDVVAALRQRYGALVSQTVIRAGVRVAEAPSHKLPITMYEPDSGVAADYRALAVELAPRLGLEMRAHAAEA
jgi:chromosome partitioning protein